MLLELKGINKFYGDFHAVKDVSMSLEEGGVYGILGRNGAGKTSTIRMIMDVYTPEKGEIIRHYTQNEVSYLPEERGIYPKMTLKDTLYFFGEIKGMKRKEIDARKDYWLEKFELKEWYTKKIENLSKGMQQKVQFITAVINEPRLLILDEPFSGMDAVNAQLMKDAMVELRKKGTTVLFSTHIIEHAENLCSSIMIINKGEKVVDGSLNTVKEKYGKRTVFVRYEGNGAVLTNEMVEKIDDYGQYAEVTLKNPETYQEYLKKIIDLVKIVEFRLDTPSLKSIFLHIAGGENNEQ